MIDSIPYEIFVDVNVDLSIIENSLSNIESFNSTFLEIINDMNLNQEQINLFLESYSVKLDSIYMIIWLFVVVLLALGLISLFYNILKKFII